VTKRVKILFAGGGTGGHLFPAIAIAEYIKKDFPETEILFVGTRNKIEANVVPQKGFVFQTIWISGLQRKLSFSNFLFPLKVIVSLMQSFFIIKKFHPNVVVGTGGYVCGPIVYVASLLKIPTVIHEQNSFPGMTTRLLSNKATQVHLTFEAARKYLKQTENIFVTGNPTRAELDNVNREDAIKYFGFDSYVEKKTLLVFGGSLGASAINNAVVNLLDELVQNNVRIIWQTGKNQIEELQKVSLNYSKNDLWISPFIERMDYAYAIADVVLCRSGATTLAEITRLGKASILVPYPFAAANHQVENANVLVSESAAEMLLEKNISTELREKIFSLLNNDEQRKELETNCRRLGKPNAGKEIAESIIALSN
jgi:UDP-N-acetylglucosamine--N-acetylmuramyl-(pentapeptide) pyrophosphoryl-undecaprenol N-acetylglucosamine transferase